MKRKGNFVPVFRKINDFGAAFNFFLFIHLRSIPFPPFPPPSPSLSLLFLFGKRFGNRDVSAFFHKKLTCNLCRALGYYLYLLITAPAPRPSLSSPRVFLAFTFIVSNAAKHQGKRFLGQDKRGDSDAAAYRVVHFSLSSVKKTREEGDLMRAALFLSPAEKKSPLVRR